jgi:hypothetical protein
MKRPRAPPLPKGEGEGLSGMRRHRHGQISVVDLVHELAARGVSEQSEEEPRAAGGGAQRRIRRAVEPATGRAARRCAAGADPPQAEPTENDAGAGGRPPKTESPDTGRGGGMTRPVAPPRGNMPNISALLRQGFGGLAALRASNCTRSSLRNSSICSRLPT